MVDVDTTNYHFNNRYSYFANASIEMIKAANAMQFERTRGNQKRKRSVFFAFASMSLYARYSFNARDLFQCNREKIDLGVGIEQFLFLVSAPGFLKNDDRQYRLKKEASDSDSPLKIVILFPLS